VSPDSAKQLAEFIAAKNQRAEKLSAIDLRRMNHLLELTPEDMTVTVESGIPLAALQRELAKHQQWLPIDPPNAETTSIHEVLSKNLSGPRRFGYGTIREHLIGMKVVLADGRTIKSGGKVVKNVAGYDLAKLFIGAGDSLGIIVEATFKLRPLPQMDAFVSAATPVGGAGQILRAVLDSNLTPVIVDAYRDSRGDPTRLVIVLGFAGTQAEVEWQLGVAHSLGFTTPASLEYEAQFWTEPGTPNRISVLPSRVAETIADIGARPCVARAGNGAIYFRGEPISQNRTLPTELMQRVKMAYDPKQILPELTL
jgi:FAD/FMN-containing dehydrogenase